MLESLFTRPAGNQGPLFLIDWHEGASPIKEAVSKSVWTLSGTGSIVTDPIMGNCYTGDGGGVWYQAGDYNLMNFSLAKWELAIDVQPTANWDGMVMSRAYASNGKGGWYLGMTAARNGIIEFYWQDINNIWRGITSNIVLPLNTVTQLRLVKTGADIKMFFGEVQVAAVANLATFNDSAILLSVAGFSDTYSGRRWIGKIGAIKFFVP